MIQVSHYETKFKNYIVDGNNVKEIPHQWQVEHLIVGQASWFRSHSPAERKNDIKICKLFPVNSSKLQVNDRIRKLQGIVDYL